MASAGTNSFATLLRRFRRASRLTQLDLAEKAGLSVGAVGMLERGLSHSPHRATLDLLIAALGLNAEDAQLLEDAARRERFFITTPPVAGERRNASVPLLGRESEFALVASHLTGARTPLLMLEGEPGIGKSRLVQEALAKATDQGWVTLEGGCHRRSGQMPYAPVVTALQAYIRALPDARLRKLLEGCAWLVRLLPELAERTLSPLPTWAGAADQERRLMFDATSRFLSQAAGSSAVLLTLDDLQWAGQDALDLLAALVRAGRDIRLRILGAYRDTEVTSADSLGVWLADLAREGLMESLHLGPLAPEAASALLDALWPDAAAADGPMREQVLARAEGVPFFLVSCVQEMRQLNEESETASPARAPRSGALAEGAKPQLDVPRSVSQSILQRIALLPSTASSLLGLAAVAGRVVAGATLLAASRRPEDEVLADLAAACHAGILKEDVSDVYRFNHDLIRETLLKELNSASRAALHRRIAEALEQDPRAERHAAELAWHFTRAGRPEKAAVYLQLAASQAQAMYAYSDAERYFRELAATLDMLGRPLDAARASEKLGTALRFSARYDESLAALEHAISEYQRMGSAEEVAHAMAELGLTYASRGLPTEGSQRLSRYLALPATQELPPAVQASLYLALTQLYRIGGRYAEMLSAAESAAALATQAQDADRRVRALFERGAALLMLGRNVEGEQALEAALSGVEELNDPVLIARALNTLAVVRDVHGDLEAGRRYVDRALTYAERSADPVLIAFMIYRRATSAFDRGDWDSARVDYEQALSMLRGVGASWALPYALRGIGMLNLMTGHEDVAIAALEDGVREAEKLGDLQVLHNLQAALAEGDLLRGDDARVIERLGSLVDDNERQSDVGNVLPSLAYAYHRLGQTERADALIERAVTVARADGAMLELGDALCVRALMYASRGQWGEAEAAGQEALALYQRMGMPYKLMRVQYALGSVYASRGDTARARTHYRAAVDICRTLGEQSYRKRAEQALKAL